MTENPIEFNLAVLNARLTELEASFHGIYGSMSIAELQKTITKKELAIEKMLVRDNALLLRELSQYYSSISQLKESPLKCSRLIQKLNAMNHILFEQVKARAELGWLYLRLTKIHGGLSESEVRRFLRKREDQIREFKSINNRIFGNNEQIAGFISESEKLVRHIRSRRNSKEEPSEKRPWPPPKRK